MNLCKPYKHKEPMLPWRQSAAAGDPSERNRGTRSSQASLGRHLEPGGRILGGRCCPCFQEVLGRGP